MPSACVFCHTRSVLFVVVGLLALSGVAVVTAGPATPADQTALQQDTAQKHTLVINTTGAPVQYTLSASGSVSGDSGEKDSVQGRTLNGRVGGVPWNNSTNDTTDTIRYTGYIETFQHRGQDIQLSLDGQRIAPTTLAANHIEIGTPSTPNNSSTPIDYRISVTGDAVTGESTETQDRTAPNSGSNGTLLQGRLTDASDSFYFTGQASVQSFAKQAHIHINGQNVTAPAQRNGSRMIPTGPSTVTANPPSPATAPSTPAPTTKTKTKTKTIEQGSKSQPTEKRTESAPTGSSSSVFGQLLQLASGLVVGALAAAVVWYYFPRQQRW